MPINHECIHTKIMVMVSTGNCRSGTCSVINTACKCRVLTGRDQPWAAERNDPIFRRVGQMLTGRSEPVAIEIESLSPAVSSGNGPWLEAGAVLCSVPPNTAIFKRYRELKYEPDWPDQ
jgi:hypothetical protein